MLLVGYEIQIDEEDIKLTENISWRIKKNSSGQIYFEGWSKLTKCSQSLHRLIMNCPKGMVVDHINGNTLDNRKQNLRICTKLQNQYNQKKHKGNRHSQYKGVTFRKELKSKPWEAFIYKEAKHKRLGYFRTELEAAKAYDIAAKQAYGDFAKLNFPEN